MSLRACLARLFRRRPPLDLARLAASAARPAPPNAAASPPPAPAAAPASAVADAERAEISARSFASGATEERDRIRAILSSPLAPGRMPLAIHLALQPSFSAAAAENILATSQREAPEVTVIPGRLSGSLATLRAATPPVSDPA